MATFAVLERFWRGEAAFPEEAWLDAARRGDSRAFDRLRGLYEAPLRGFVARRVGIDVAEDLAQEIWLACWQSLPKYAGRSRFKAWLYGIAAHKCTDCLRLRIQEEQRRQAVPLDTQETPDIYHAVALKQTIRQALRRLPDEQREALELYYYAGLTLAEIAQALNRNVNTVKYQFYRGHACVAQALENSDA